MNKIKICTPVVGKTLNEFLKNLTQVQKVSSMVELRVDGMNLTKKDLLLIRKKVKKEAILTSRNKENILMALDLGFDLIDIDFSTISGLDLSEKMKKKIILSFHDFEKTPEVNRLKLLVDQMKKFNTGIIKIATVVKSDRDIKNLFQILINKKENEKMIIIGIGKKGQITRIFGPLLGSFLTFASTKFGVSAPGQIDIEKMKNIYKLLNY